jgi:predicted ATP-dependent serine protease
LLTTSVTIRSVFEIVGREEELGSLYAFIGEAGGRLAALVLEGEAGIGKSTLWLAGLEHARTRGLRVLSSRPSEAERSLASGWAICSRTSSTTSCLR